VSPIDDPNDPDFISEDGTTSGGPPLQPLWTRPMRGSSNPYFIPDTSIAFEEDDSAGVIPICALWAMKYKQHGHLFGKAEAVIRKQLGEGDHSIYVIDDGRKHCLVSRNVGTTPDGCTYCLVGQIDVGVYERLVDDATLTDTIFSEARDLSLCSVYENEQAVSNVLDVQSFAHVEDVPSDYLPPHPRIEFTDVPDGS
jgi:hypothetical protein